MSALQSRASSLQSTSQGNSIRTQEDSSTFRSRFGSRHSAPDERSSRRAKMARKMIAAALLVVLAAASEPSYADQAV